MIKNIMLYRWKSLLEPLAFHVLEELGYKCIPCEIKMKNYAVDMEASLQIIELLHGENIDAIFSYNYFPILSQIAEINKIPYLSWIYDSPLYTIPSPEIQRKYTYLFCFDKIYADKISKRGANYCCHFPMAADIELFQAIIARNNREANNKKQNYIGDVAFVGNLYNDENNRFGKAVLTDYSGGYIEGLINAQMKISGFNLIGQGLKKEVAQELADKLHLTLGEHFPIPKQELAKDIIGKEVSARRRKRLIELICQNGDLNLYSNSEIPESLKHFTTLHAKGHVDYIEEMPLVFHNSRINVNITATTIESGVPQRVFDILGCGGFCLTDYQPELEELFEIGKELVVYSKLEEVGELIEYYLTHEDQRKAIAEAGFKKVKTSFDIKERMNKIIDFVMEDVAGLI